jgi:hypothetical protein
VLGFWESVPANLTGSLMLRPILGADPVAISPVLPAPGTTARLLVYPNPAAEQCRLALDAEHTPQAATVRITDLLGQTVRHETYRETLSLDGLSDGLYLVTVLDANARPIAREKLIVCRP